MKLQNLSKIGLLVSALALSLTACTQKSQTSNINTAKGKSGIIDGVPVEDRDALSKSTVYLRIVFFDDAGQATSGAQCTGTLVAENLVVTAAHCLPAANEKNYQYVIAFNKDLNAVKKEDIRAVRRFLGHPNYVAIQKENQTDEATTVSESAPQEESSQFESANDIALLSFEGTIPTGFAPAKLLKDDSLLVENMPVTLSGYGLTKSEGETVEHTSVLRKGPAIFLGFVNRNEAVLDQSQGGLGGGACKGDSGGPASVVIGGAEYVWGVTSRGGNPNDLEKPCNGLVIYTSIASHDKFMTIASKLLLEELNDTQASAVGQ